jgi:hypothetical protein
MGKVRATARTPDQVASLVTDANKDEYKEPPPINDLFKVVLQATVQSADALKRKQLIVDLGLSEEEGQAQLYVGVFTGKFDRWATTVNWTPEDKVHLRAYHIHVSYNGEDAAILAPYTTMPSVWFLHFVKPKDLREACASEVADKTGRSRLFDSFGGQLVHDEKVELGVV